MRIRSSVAILLLVAAACGGDRSVPAGQDDGGSGLVTENVERAQDVADQLDQRESQLEEMVDDMGG